MKRNRMLELPVWVYIVLAVGTAWSSGIYLGRITVEGAALSILLKTIAFGCLSIIFTVSALSHRHLD